MRRMRKTPFLARLAVVIGLCLAAAGPPRAATAQVSPEDSTARGLLMQARFLTRAGKYDEALDFARRSLAQWEKETSPDAPGLVDPIDHLAYLHGLQGNRAEAREYRLRAIAILEKAHGKEDTELLPELLGLAVLYRAEGDDRQAEPLLLRAVAIAKQVSASRPQIASAPLAALAELYVDQGDPARAEPLL
jgi:tetratricopeptide (TPR) repeat protein